MADLERFVIAQASAYAEALAELRAGQKRTHWMWFVFPQLRGLGRSTTAQFYGIEGIGEARAYLAHHLLGPRLIECTQAVPVHEGRSAQEIFGSPDDLKFRSSMTLFNRAGGGTMFEDALKMFYGGVEDGATVEMLG